MLSFDSDGYVLSSRLVDALQSGIAAKRFQYAQIDRLLVFLLLSTCPAFAQTTAKPVTTTVVHAPHMLDGVSKEMQGAVTVTIVNGRITDVKPGTLSVAGAEVVELGGATLLPGLIDAHKHMGAPNVASNGFQQRLTIGSMEDAISSAANARKLLEEGFTTVQHGFAGRDRPIAETGHRSRVGSGTANPGVA